MTVHSLPLRKCVRVRPYVLVLERQRTRDARAFAQFAGLMILTGLGVRR